MKIRVLESFVSSSESGDVFVIGREYEVSASDGAGFCSAGLAVPVAGPDVERAVVEAPEHRGNGRRK